MATTKRLICIFDCEDHAGFPNMIKDFLGDAYEYEVFQAPKLLLPPVDETSRYDCFILTGSLTSAHETEKEIPGTWVQKFGQYVKDLTSLIIDRNRTATKKQKLIGICFGQQIIAHYLGGKCEKAEQPRHGIEKLKFEPQFYEVKAVRTAAKEVFGMSPPFDELLFPSIEPIEFRSDYLSQIPPSATLLAKSKYSPAEAFTIGDDILGLLFYFFQK
eukprot:MONOS_13556.2-p1 / transcript=MONOS_13556.2 / gene=MONOS_13556 / organism=Monocercomonoides_exilis_PA203 / gene_product=class I glutamine amidotransferase domain containing protein , unspecified product / transcript_product=unspecified product / location=Mono_scaffold00844:19416-20121(-) / protein_length=215 / sequence_SO=supercontig / SO=protein_coding / is_pseudo=false